MNEEKIKGGLHKLAEDVKKTGMKFGIWVEPEMISPDSDLYKRASGLGDSDSGQRDYTEPRSVCIGFVQR